MKRFFPALVFGFALLWVALSWLPQKPPAGDVDLAKLGKIPVLVGGRVKPLDTVARNSLLIIHTKETVRLTNGKQLTAIQWLADTLFNAPVADQYPVFVIQNAEVLGLFGWEQSDRKYFSFVELSPFLKQINDQGELVGQAAIGRAFRLSECNSQFAQRAGPLSKTEKQSSAGKRKKLPRRTGIAGKEFAGGGTSRATTRRGRKFRQSETG